MAIQVKTIQMRRGLAVDFDPSKLVPGEWAISQDNSKIYICISQGNVIEIAEASSIHSYMVAAEAWAVGTKDGVPVDITDIQYDNYAKYYSQHAATSEANAATSETNAATSETNAGQYWQYVHDAVDLVTPTIDINWSTGQLEMSGSAWFFKINQTTGQLEWSISAI